MCPAAAGVGAVGVSGVEGLWIAAAAATAEVDAGADSGPSLLRLGNVRTLRRVQGIVGGRRFRNWKDIHQFIIIMYEISDSLKIPGQLRLIHRK